MATFVLVHGSMHGGWCWKRVAPLLRAAGHDVFTPTLTGLGERVHLAHPDVDLDTHIRDVLGVLEYEDLREVVLIGHSYGAMVITGVADRMPERIDHLVYLDGAMASDGQAVLDLFPPEWGASRRAHVEAAGEGWRLLPPVDLTVWGIAQGDVAWVRAKLAPQPFKTFIQPLGLMSAAGFEGSKTFIACLEAPPAPWRDAMIDQVRAGHDWRYRELATGHDAMITAPRALTELLLEIIEPIC
jgi:pimeloyl-ACP methyl ester carboxylesterase